MYLFNKLIVQTLRYDDPINAIHHIFFIFDDDTAFYEAVDFSAAIDYAIANNCPDDNIILFYMINNMGMSMKRSEVVQ